jgi:Leucine-rich repeat (LRR) protein
MAPVAKTKAVPASPPAARKAPSFFSCLPCFKQPEEEVSELDFAHCSLDNVPNDIFAFERTLEHLYLECNSIRDLPRQLFQCQELRVLNLSDNDVQQIPQALSSLSQLVELNVSKNVLREIPDTVKQLKHLAVLDASVNPLQKIPEGCTQLLSITELYLNDTFLEFLPANFGRLVKLKILELRENSLSTLPKSLSRLSDLRRLDLGQNDLSEVPEVVGSLPELRELWLDGNRIRIVPDLIGHLVKLNHLEASFNHIEVFTDAIVNCTSLTNLCLTTNDLKELPEGVCALPSLVTLKVDDNQLESLPAGLGFLASLEELVASQNYLEHLPPSVGLCRRLHTLNVDDNDIEVLPKEIGSCTALRILSVHGNRLTALPAELDHISELAVLNLTGNMIQNLPVSFMKLRKITAIWLSENQNKPLIQLNQDTDPETGQKVLTNFMLPQQPETDFFKGGNGDNVSVSSFHASVWEEERQKRSHVKWAGDRRDQDGVDNRQLNGSGGKHDEEDDGSSGQLRREPTPFPKEMRAMAKRMQNLRQSGKEAGAPAQSSTAMDNQRKKSRSGRERSPSLNNASESEGEAGGAGIDLGIRIREAKVSKPHASPVLSERHLMSVYREEKTIKEQMELKQFEELERSLIISSPKTDLSAANYQRQQQHPLHNQPEMRRSPDKTSRDSGVITPSDGSVTSPENEQSLPPPPPLPPPQGRKPSDPLPQAPPPVRPEIATNELEPDQAPKRPPPYHIAAALSKHAGDFNAVQNTYENQQRQPQQQTQQKHQRDSSFISDTCSDVSTAPSSLQTIVRAPYSAQVQAHLMHRRESASANPSNSSEAQLQQHQMPQQPLLRSLALPVAQSKITSLKKKSADQTAEETDAHALHLRKVSEQLLSNPRTRQSVTGIPLFSSSRPGSFASPMGGGSSGIPTPSGSSQRNGNGMLSRPSSVAAPHNTIGLPSPSPRTTASNSNPSPSPRPLSSSNQVGGLTFSFVHARIVVT